MFGRYRSSSPFAWMGWVAVVVGCLALDGFIFKCLWNWNVARVFSLRTINIYEGVGLVLVVMMFKSTPEADLDDGFLQVFWRICGNEIVCFAAALLLHLVT